MSTPILSRKVFAFLALLALCSLATPAFAQLDWQQQHPATAPAARDLHAMAWDGQRVILFGGLTLGGGRIVGDTWAWDGTQWTQLNPAHSPSLRDLHSMVYDAARNQIVLFGGTGSTTFGDTWIWNGSDWVNMTPTMTDSPSPRIRPRMAYDPVNQEVLLYGGHGIGSFNDLWAWNGTTWTQRTPQPAFPEGRYYAPVMSYDPIGQGFVLFGGLQTTAGPGILYNDTWFLKNSAFTQLSPATSPSIRASDNYFALDTDRQVSLLFGGITSNGVSSFVLGDTWQWDGSNWTQLAPATVPPARQEQAMAYDPVHQQMVMFGGLNATNTMLNDTWTYGIPQGIRVVVPAGVQFSIDGTTYTGSQTIQTAPGTYTLSTTALQATGVGAQQVFLSWSDGGALSHSVTVGSSLLTVIGSFQTQYLMTASANPSSGGTVNVVGNSAGPYYDAGSVVSVFEAPNAGYLFTGWTGSCGGTGICFVTMNAPATVTANFSHPTFSLTINVPADIKYTLGGFPFQGAATVSLPASTYSIGLAPIQSPGAGTQRVFLSWSDGGAASHDVVLNSNLTVNGTFKTQYLLTATSAVATQGSANGGWFDAGTPGIATAIPAAGYDFAYWTGDCPGQVAFCLLTMNAPKSTVAHFTPTMVTFRYPGIPSPARFGAAIAYDAFRKDVVLFGGVTGGAFLRDTWEFKGGSWFNTFADQLSLDPWARNIHSMAYHAGTKTVLLAGGSIQPDVPNGDYLAYAFDGTTWKQVAELPGPRALNPTVGTQLGEFGNDVLMFSGLNPTAVSNGIISDGILNLGTYIWDGAKWNQPNATHHPPGRFNGFLVYDSVRKEAVLVGGQTPAAQGGQIFQDTWVFDGNDWTQRTPATPLGAVALAAAYDPTIQQTVVFGGDHHIWTWDGFTWMQRESYPGSGPSHAVYNPDIPGVFGVNEDDSNYIRLAPKPSLVFTGPVTISKNAGTYNLSFQLTNQGNVPISGIFGVTGVITVGGSSVSGTVSVSNQAPFPGQAASVNVTVPTSVGPGPRAFTVQGSFANFANNFVPRFSTTVLVNLP